MTRAALAGVASVAALAAGTTTAHADQATPLSAAPETTAQFQVMHSGKCLEINNGQADNGLAAQQWTCANVAAQQWRVVPVADSSFELRSAASGKCLEVENSGTQAGARVQQWTCTGGKQQRWRLVLVDQANKVFQLRPTHVEDRCLDVSGAKTDNGIKAQSWYCNQSDAQLWQIKPVK
ncbi:MULTISPECIES: RICIN domain-containing protein [Streptomyces]|uniref:RICIN domain-containing protein n=1 Tax=Streptomyces TaxID=1883 RepID=UPI0031EFD2B2